MRQTLTRSMDPSLFPLEIGEHGEIRLIVLSEAEYRTASFLDKRLLTTQRQGVWIPWSQIAAEAQGLPTRCHFIFHIGHVGSTLISRLVGEHHDLFSLREPAILRAFANAYGRAERLTGAGDAEDRLSAMLALWSRTWRPTQTAVIKATSFVSQMATHLLERVDSARAIMIFTKPPAFLRGILGGPASREELRAMAPSRLLRLNRWLGADVYRPDQLCEGELIAMSWLCEMGALHDAAALYKDRALWIDFDRFLGQPEHGLEAILAHLGTKAGSDEGRAIVNGSLMRRYAKAPEHAYDADLRRQVLVQADRDHGLEVRRGMDWLGRAAQSYAKVRDVLQAAARIGSDPPRGSAFAHQSPGL